MSDRILFVNTCLEFHNYLFQDPFFAHHQCQDTKMILILSTISLENIKKVESHFCPMVVLCCTSHCHVKSQDDLHVWADPRLCHVIIFIPVLGHLLGCCSFTLRLSALSSRELTTPTTTRALTINSRRRRSFFTDFSEKSSRQQLSSITT